MERGSELTADVYAVEKEDDESTWIHDTIIDPIFDPFQKINPYTLCIEVDNTAGVLNQVHDILNFKLMRK